MTILDTPMEAPTPLMSPFADDDNLTTQFIVIAIDHAEFSKPAPGAQPQSIIEVPQGAVVQVIDPTYIGEPEADDSVVRAWVVVSERCIKAPTGDIVPISHLIETKARHEAEQKAKQDEANIAAAGGDQERKAARRAKRGGVNTPPTPKQEETPDAP